MCNPDPSAQCQEVTSESFIELMDTYREYVNSATVGIWSMSRRGLGTWWTPIRR